MIKSNPQIRNISRALMKGNWTIGVTVTLIYFVIASIAGASELVLNYFFKGIGSIVYFGLYLLVVLPLAFGFYIAFLRLCKEKSPLSLQDVLTPFKDRRYFAAGIYVQLLYTITIFLWSLLLIVPGIIKACAYILAPFIVAENPDISAREALKLSAKMMQGHKMQLFRIILTTIGWTLISIPFGMIPMFWITPYYMTIYTNFYLTVKEEHQQ